MAIKISNNSPSTGESDPSLLKLNPPRKPGGENWGGLSCLGGNWRPRSLALMSGNWGSWANMGGIPGSVLPAERKGEGGKGNAGLAAVSLARRAALAAMFSLRGKGRGKPGGSCPAIRLCSIIAFLEREESTWKHQLHQLPSQSNINSCFGKQCYEFWPSLVEYRSPLCPSWWCWGWARHPAWLPALLPAGQQQGELWQPSWRSQFTLQSVSQSVVSRTCSAQLVQSDWGQLWSQTAGTPLLLTRSAVAAHLGLSLALSPHSADHSNQWGGSAGRQAA